MEEKEIKKEQRTIDNASYKERFQFMLSINDNIICQRYFRINGFNAESLESEELKYVMDEIVELIQQELISKSRIYMWYTRDEPMKLTGFTNVECSEGVLRALIDTKVVGKICDEDGNIYDKSYFEYPTEMIENDDEKPEDGEFVFKFSFLVDDKPVYTYAWDANVYPKYVRNSVDLTNSDAAYKDRDPMSLNFSAAIIYRLTYGRSDLVYSIIKKICDTLSNTYTDSFGNYTKKVVYSNKNGDDKTYYYTPYNKVVVNEWRKVLEQKTRQYENWVNNNFSQKYLDYIDKYL